MENKIIDRNSYIFSAVLFLISFLIVFTHSSEFFGSLLAATLTAALGFISYVLVRLLWLSLK